jgi:putative transposase
MPDLIGDYTRKCQGIRIDRKLRSADLVDVRSDQFILRGVPDHVRPGNGPKFAAKAVRQMIAAVGARPATARASTQKLRGEFLNDKIFYSLTDARIVFVAGANIIPERARLRPCGTGLRLKRSFDRPLLPSPTYIESATGPL